VKNKIFTLCFIGALWFICDPLWQKFPLVAGQLRVLRLFVRSSNYCSVFCACRSASSLFGLTTARQKYHTLPKTVLILPPIGLKVLIVTMKLWKLGLICYNLVEKNPTSAILGRTLLLTKQVK
jgi:hypothetical protein